MLSPKERLNKVFTKEEVDRPPCICPGGMMNMVTTELMDEVGISLPAAHSDAQMMADLARAVYEKGCFENFGVPFCMTVEAEELGAKVDMGSNIYEPHVVEYAINSVNEWTTLSKINFEDGRSKVVLDAIKILKSKKDDVPIIGNLTGPISTASSIIEPVVFYKQLRKSNKEAHEFLEFVTDELILFAKKQIEAGADIIAISDPSGTGEILGPKLFEEFAVKYLNKLIHSIQKENIATIVHICGQMKNVYSEVNKVRSNVLSFDSMVSIKEARKNLGDRLLMGNVSTYTIEFGEANKIAQLTQRCVEDGSNIISPACGLGMKSPLKNIRSMIESLTKGDAISDA
ncbi:methylcobamide:CoM methyltransferase MtbA [Clostridium cylindrosporum]|uniref:Methylcobamide:CoM methyltransferase MtbA n=1 Tax=Clostridium cylindrosporum DSM 605 TaxID=1121307 RepID=A0A0J8D9P0_CLOCY|nr:methylcobamide:CoM methyltransferase MtbA [Clostridium cylindrosporum]KMT21029.1 methylcobamide:CoM methyltransferase MtbA [Clostridium cylindrosporum DSM 605]